MFLMDVVDEKAQIDQSTPPDMNQCINMRRADGAEPTEEERELRRQIFNEMYP